MRYGWAALGGGVREGSWGVTVAHSEAHRRLQGCSWPGLTADMVEGKKEVMVLGHTGGKSQLEFLVEFRRPGKIGPGAGGQLGSGNLTG